MDRWDDVIKNNKNRGGRILSITTVQQGSHTEHTVVTNYGDGAIGTDVLVYEDGVLQSWTMAMNLEEKDKREPIPISRLRNINRRNKRFRGSQ